LQNSFSNCPNLVAIQITNGNIPAIPAGIAQTGSKLVGIFLTQNNIVRIDRDAFKGSNNLNYLNLSYNKITCLRYDLFQNTPSLRTIDFSYNKITALDWNLFRNLPFLNSVDFKFNLITSLPYFDLTTTATSFSVSSFTFYFDNNQINSINPDICYIFASRSFKMDVIYFTNNPCVRNGVNVIANFNCQQMAS